MVCSLLFRYDVIRCNMTKQNNRNLSLLLILTQLGSGVLAFILSFSILQQNKSALDFSMTVVVSTIFSIITSVISGKFIDKYNKKENIIICSNF